MDIRNWPVGWIMQLPDCCFGQKFDVIANIDASDDETAWDISEIAYPDKMVLWQVGIMWLNNSSSTGVIRIAIGEQLPRSVAMMNQLQPLLQGLGRQGPEPRNIRGSVGGLYEHINMRRYMEPQGRRLIIEATAAASKYTWVRVHTVVSSLPNEVPDWLLSNGRVG